MPRESTAHAVGSGSAARTVAAPAPGSVSTSYDGSATLVEVDDLRFAIARRISPGASDAPSRQTVAATWAGQGIPFALAFVWDR